MHAHKYPHYRQFTKICYISLTDLYLELRSLSLVSLVQVFIKVFCLFGGVLTLSEPREILTLSEPKNRWKKSFGAKFILRKCSLLPSKISIKNPLSIRLLLLIADESKHGKLFPLYLKKNCNAMKSSSTKKSYESSSNFFVFFTYLILTHRFIFVSKTPNADRDWRILPILLLFEPWFLFIHFTIYFLRD